MEVERKKLKKNGKKVLKIILISGTPGTGKTKLAKILAKRLKGEHIEVNKALKERKMYDSYDKSKKTFIIPEKALIWFLEMMISEKGERIKGKYLILDSHMSHFFRTKKIKVCIITTCELKTLKKRLKKRGYNKAKIRENLDSEIFEVCKTEALEAGHKVLEVDTTKGILTRKIAEILKAVKTQ